MLNDHAILELSSGKTTQKKDFWCLIAIEPEKHQKYLDFQASGTNVNLNEYGEILASGWGTKPSEGEMHDIKKTYSISMNFEHDLEKHILRQLRGMKLYLREKIKQKKPIF